MFYSCRRMSRCNQVWVLNIFVHFWYNFISWSRLVCTTQVWIKRKLMHVSSICLNLKFIRLPRVVFSSQQLTVTEGVITTRSNRMKFRLLSVYLQVQFCSGRHRAQQSLKMHFLFIFLLSCVKKVKQIWFAKYSMMNKLKCFITVF